MAVIKISRTVALDAPILTEALHGTLFTTEGQAHEFTIHCTQGGAAVTLSGTVTAKFIREETGDTILCAGSLSSGAAKVTLPADCYHRSGRFSMTIFVTSGSVATVVYACTGTVKAAEDGTLIDEGTITPSYEEILQQLATLNAKFPVSIANGGTGATTVSGALTNLGYANTSYNQASGTLAGALSSAGVWLITVHDSANFANYWTGIGNRVSGANPTFVTIANNGINSPYGNTIGTVVFSGATGNYVARCVKLL